MTLIDHRDMKDLVVLLGKPGTTDTNKEGDTR